MTPGINRPGKLDLGKIENNLMCGIVGALAQRDVSSILMEGLHRLEYRGYDSAGIALISDQKLERFRDLGKVKELTAKVPQKQPGKIGIAHTMNL